MTQEEQAACPSQWLLEGRERLEDTLLQPALPAEPRIPKATLLAWWHSAHTREVTAPSTMGLTHQGLKQGPA